MLAAIVVWWFLLTGIDGDSRIVGPFETQQRCEEIRMEVAAGKATIGWRAATSCWRGPR